MELNTWCLFGAQGGNNLDYVKYVCLVHSGVLSPAVVGWASLGCVSISVRLCVVKTVYFCT